MQGKIEYPTVGVFDVLKALWRGIRPQAWVFFLAVSSLIVAQVFDKAFIPLYYKYFFDTVTAATVPAGVLSTLISIVVTIAFCNVTRIVFRRVSEFALSAVEAKSMARLRQSAFDYLIRHSQSFFANSFTGSLVQRVSRFARSLERLLDTLLYNLIPLAVTIIAAIVITWRIEPILSYVIAAWIILFFLFNFFFSLWRIKYNVKVAEADSKTTGTLADIIANQNEVSLFAAFRDESKRFKEVTAEQARITLFTWNLANVFDAVQAFLIFLAEFFIFYYGAQLWASGALTVGTLVLVQIYVVQLSGQLWDFGRIIRTLHEVFADCKEMVEIMTLPHEIHDLPGAEDILLQKGTIVFDDVTFNFHDTRKVLDAIDVTIPGGQKVALVGPSGAGKTTVIRLLLRLYEVSAGRITIDGEDIKRFTLDSLHRSIALVPQDPVLFHRSLMENIRYGYPEASDEKVMEAAHLSHCDEFIDALPEKYETFVGERGIKLSGGERQRVAIARAILKNAPILILDEATSSLDSHSESLIQDALDTLMKGKTAIVIAHRLSTIRKMDRIIVIDNGVIREDGTHESLLADETSLYRTLWELQAGGFIVEEED